MATGRHAVRESTPFAPRRATLLAWALAGLPLLPLCSLAGCRTAAREPVTSFPRPGGSERLTCTVEATFLRVSLEATPVDRWGVWVEDGQGARIEPASAFDAAGIAVELGGVGAAHVQTVLFPLAELASRPWTLCVLPRAAPAWRILLAEVEEASIDRAHDAFGYRRETWLFPDGARRVSLARSAPDGSRVVVRAEFERAVSDSVTRTAAALPGTVREAFVACPELRDLVARGFEGGARYCGPAEGEDRHPHARGERFWSRPQLRGAGEDPIDSLVWFLVELFNASSAASYAQIWQGVLDGSLTEEQYLAQETLQKAAQVSRAVRTIQANAECLDLAQHRAAGAAVFEEYERWVDASGGDLRSLAGIILRNPARYTQSPREAGLTYGERLRGLYRRHAPVSGARPGP